MTPVKSSSSNDAREYRIPSPFLVVRFAVFALLVFLNFQILVFSAWNINAAISSSYPVPGVMIFFIFDCCLLYFFLVVAMIEYIRPHTNTGQIKFEIAWSGALSLLYAGVTIAFTINGPVLACQASIDWSVCASSSLLLPVTWACTLMLLGYFFGLVILSVVHMHTYPRIWDYTVYNFPWFRRPDTNQDDPYVSGPHRDGGESLANFDTASRSSKLRVTLDPPSWAKALQVRRGKDDPFALGNKHRFKPSVSDSSVTLAHSIVSHPETAYVIETAAGSKYAKEPRTPSHDNSPFPAAVENQDAPIPLPRLSYWLRADATNGVNVHTVPIPSP